MTFIYISSAQDLSLISYLETGILKAVRAHSKRSNIFPSSLEISKFASYVNACDPLLRPRQEAAKKEAAKLYKEWLWLTQLNFNILVYGIGDKYQILRSFQSDCLHDEVRKR